MNDTTKRVFVMCQRKSSTNQQRNSRIEESVKALKGHIGDSGNNWHYEYMSPCEESSDDEDSEQDKDEKSEK